MHPIGTDQMLHDISVGVRETKNPLYYLQDGTCSAFGMSIHKKSIRQQKKLKN